LVCGGGIGIPDPALADMDTIESRSATMALERELATFERLKAELVKTHVGKFALIKGEEFLGSFDNPSNAYQEGVTRFGRDSFLVKRIGEEEEVYRNQALYLGLMNARL